jgi:glutathione S-transferase
MLASMTLVLHHHPFTRAANVVWMLEEVGSEYLIEHVDIMSGAHKTAPFRKMNPMGKIPTLLDGDTVVTEAAAIGLYLADRFALGRLAPEPSAKERGTYLRWSLYAPSVIEPGCMAHGAKWELQPARAGWGTYEEMLDTISAAIGDGPWLLGDTFSMADVIFGGTVRWMTMFGMLEKRPEYLAYVERLSARPAAIAAQKINDRIVEERGLKRG